MNRKEISIAIGFFFFVSCIFFYKTILHGFIPFPGDLLINTYNPWRNYSYLGYNPGSFPSKMQYFDVIRQMYPWVTFTVSSLKQLQLPLWNPYNFSGSPLFANSQSSVLYPLRLFYLFLPQVLAWTMLVFLEPFLISIFTYLYARKIGIGIWGGILAALSFAYSLFISVFLEYNTIDHVVLFLPCLLFFTELILDNITFLRLFLFSIAIACAALAGHIQIFGFIIVVLALYISFRLSTVRKKISKKKLSFLFFLLFLLGCGISAAQLLPTIELITYAARVPQNYGFLLQNLLIQPQQVLLFLSPDIFGNPASGNYLLSNSYPTIALYVGLIPFLFAIGSMWLFKENIFVKFYTIGSFILFLFLFRSPITQVFYTMQIPLFSTGSPSNAIFLLSFMLSILGGYGFSLWLKNKTKLYLIISCLTFCSFIVGIGLLKIFHIPFVIKNVYYTLGIFLMSGLLLFGAWFFPKRKLFFGFCLVIVVIGDLFYFFQKFNPFVPTQAVFPQTSIVTFLQSQKSEQRFWSYGSAAIEPNFATAYALFDANGYDPLYPKWYGTFLQATNNGKLITDFTDATRSDATITQGFGSTSMLNNFYRQKILNLLGISFIVSRLENGDQTVIFPSTAFQLMYQEGNWRVYKNLSALPRTFLVYKTNTYTNEHDFEQKFFSNDFNPKNTILLPTPITPLTTGTGSATILSYKPNTVSIKTVSSTKAILFLSDTYYPGWHVSVDGNPSVILKADYAFRAALVPQGVHTIIFSYEPASFSVGLVLTILSIGSLLILGFLIKKIA